jgi:hypothetical protein
MGSDARTGVLLAALTLFVAGDADAAWAQHEGHGDEPPPAGQDDHARPGEHEAHAMPAGHDHAAHAMPDVHAHHQRAHGHAGGPATSREGSGTAWLPDSSPMYAIHAMAAGWRFMFHGNLHAGMSWQGSPRGDHDAISTNWLMAMASHDLAGGELTLRAMLSLEPLTVGRDGYSLLLQSGEAYQGQPIVDRQHPHDLFMELAARYRRDVGGGVAAELYGGPVGEPALGPMAFPHRPSAMPNPLAPLGHHWLDSTHISMGVVTVGVGDRHARLEGSWFNGREPDDDRYDIELRAFDSYATRLSLNPTPHLSVQASYGYLASPEQLEPDASVSRLTASATYDRPVGARGDWATTIAWGRNLSDHAADTDALLLESALTTDRAGTPFVRLEQVEKAGHDLALAGALADATFTVHSAGAGYRYELPALGPLRPGVGAVATLTHLVDDELAAVYEGHTLYAAMVFVTLRPVGAAGMHH